jgi:hypothetical protein
LCGQINVPPRLARVVAIAAGGLHSLALQADGTLVAWGDNLAAGQTNLPPGLTGVVAIAAGFYHSLALKSDGTVVAWGSNAEGQSEPPAGLTGVVAIAAGYAHSLALKADGSVVAWGSHIGPDETCVPEVLDPGLMIQGGYGSTLALVNTASSIDPPQLLPYPGQVAVSGLPMHLRLLATGLNIVFDAQGLPAGLVLDPATGVLSGTPTRAGVFPVVISAENEHGQSEWPIQLRIWRSRAPGLAGMMYLLFSTP